MLGRTAVLLIVLFPMSVGAATYTVANLNETGAGSLHQAIVDANTNSGPDDIEFSVAGTIFLIATHLPAITDDGTRILGETAPDAFPIIPDVTVWRFYSYPFPGIHIEQADACVVTGLNLVNFPVAIWVEGPASGNQIGTSESIRTANVISGDTEIGITLTGIDCTSNYVRNNNVGQCWYWGVALQDGAWNNWVGGFGERERNVVSGCGTYGIYLTGTVDATSYNRILNNYVGTDYEGLTANPNGQAGIKLSGSSCANNLIVGNLVSGNDGDGIVLEDCHHNHVQECLVGTDVTGAVSLANQGSGIVLQEGAHHNGIGQGNIVSGNGVHGVLIRQAGTDHNVVDFNRIGLDADGTGPLGNLGDGVVIEEEAQSCTIRECTISSNQASGIRISGVGTDSHRVTNCLIGTDRTGMVPLANGTTGDHAGIRIEELSKFCTIGPGNLLAAHAGADQAGITLIHEGTSFHTVFENIIGLNLDQTAAMANYYGVEAIDDALDNDIGPNNVISGNLSHGGYTESERVHFRGNWIGVDGSGLQPFGNGGSGLYITQGWCDVGGAMTVGDGNFICANAGCGIEFHSYTPYPIDLVAVQGNSIGVSADGSPLGNGSHGIWFGDSHWGEVVGSTSGGTSDLGNEIAYNGGDGVRIGESFAWLVPSLITVLSNSIHTNGGNGIELVNGGNDLIPAPVILSATEGHDVTGTIDGGIGLPALVQVFADHDDEGGELIGEATTMSSNWSVTVTGYTAPYITATVTGPYASGTQTSPFGNAYVVSPAGAPDDEVAELEMLQPSIFPSPFSRSMTIRYALEAPGSVQVTVYDLQGRRVASVLDRLEEAGTGSAVWNGISDRGVRVGPGIYFVRIETPGRVVQRSAVRLW